MTKRNEPIGEVECPHKGCALLVPVFRFRPRETENMRRFAGKLYGNCPKHGRFGGSPGDTDTQEYILDKGTIWGAEKPAGERRQAPAAPPPAAPAKAEKLPAMQKRSPPASPPASPPEPPAPKRPRGWGFFAED